MKIEALALVDIVIGEKQEIVWICASHEIESQEMHWAKLQTWMNSTCSF